MEDLPDGGALAALPAGSRRKAEDYLALVLEANRRVNLTADQDAGSLLRRHFADGLAAAGLLREFLKAAVPEIADLGSGAGFIGMAVKLAWPEARVSLIERVQRKFDFLNVAAARSGLKGLRVLKRGAPSFDAVLARAVAPLPEALALAAPLLKPEGGLLLIFQTEAPDPAAPALARALERTGASMVECRRYRLPGESADRTMAVFKRG